jgi:hypothetical protein
MQETSRVATFEKDNRVAAKWKEGHRGDAGLRQFIDKRVINATRDYNSSARRQPWRCCSPSRRRAHQ